MSAKAPGQDLLTYQTCTGIQPRGYLIATSRLFLVASAWQKLRFVGASPAALPFFVPSPASAYEIKRLIGFQRGVTFGEASTPQPGGAECAPPIR